MVNLIEFPTNWADPDSRPRAGDRYEPYGLAGEQEPVTLTFRFPGGLRESFPYSRMSLVQFKPLDGSKTGEGEGRISEFFDMTRGIGVLVDVFGDDLRHCASVMCNRRLGWVWVLPKDRVVSEGSPVVRRIKYQHVESSDLSGLMSRD